MEPTEERRREFMSETLSTMPNPGLDSLTDDQLAACAHRLAHRSRLRSSLNGKDAADFVQDAVRKLLEGKRKLDPRFVIEENVLRIGLSLVWSERQRRREEALNDESAIAARGESDAMPVDAPDLRDALTDATRLLHASPIPGRVGRDAIDFVACLSQQLEQGESIKPGHVAELLEISAGRAYAAWRRVKTLMREHYERPQS